MRQAATFIQHLRGDAAVLLVLCFLVPPARAQRLLEPSEYLKDPKFKDLYVKTLGPKAKTPWLAKMDGPAPTTRKVRVIGSEFVLAAFCKNQDCGENSAVLLYAADRGQLYGTIYEKGKTTVIGEPSPGLAIELNKLWKKEWRQQ
jgi:Inhibitor of vertebrate lysozyme (Ivy)